MKYQNIKKILLLVSFSVLLGLFSVSKSIAAELVAPQIPIERASIKLKESLKDETFLNDFAKINDFVEEVIAPHTDFHKIAKLVVGKYWKRASDEEQKNFEQEFKVLLVRTYSRAFVDFDNWTMTFLPLDMDKAVKTVKNKQAVTVKTQILQPGQRPFSISYRMWRTDENWKIYDIVIEGISLVKNYRTSIGSRIKKSGSSLASVTEFLAKKNRTALAKKEEKNKEEQS